MSQPQPPNQPDNPWASPPPGWWAPPNAYRPAPPYPTQQQSTARLVVTCLAAVALVAVANVFVWGRIGEGLSGTPDDTVYSDAQPRDQVFEFCRDHPERCLQEDPGGGELVPFEEEDYHTALGISRLNPGDCYELVQQRTSYVVRPLACSAPHRFQYVGPLDFTEITEKYGPPNRAVERQECERVAAEFTGVPAARTRTPAYPFEYRARTLSDDTRVHCVIVSYDGKPRPRSAIAG